MASWSLWRPSAHCCRLLRDCSESVRNNPDQPELSAENRAILLCPVFDRGINSIGELFLLFSLGHHPIVRESCETAGFHSKLLSGRPKSSEPLSIDHAFITKHLKARLRTTCGYKHFVSLAELFLLVEPITQHRCPIPAADRGIISWLPEDVGSSDQCRRVIS